MEDPKDYRHCGYAEAVAGSAKALGSPCGKAAPAMDRDNAKRVVEQVGELPPAPLLRLRVRYSTDGVKHSGIMVPRDPRKQVFT